MCRLQDQLTEEESHVPPHEENTSILPEKYTEIQTVKCGKDVASVSDKLLRDSCLLSLKSEAQNLQLRKKFSLTEIKSSE